MKKTVMTMWLCVVGIVLGASVTGWGAPMGTATTYQGRLMDGDSPADEEYDFEFKLYTDSAAGYQVGITVNKENEPVSAGLFTVQLDLVGSDPNAFNGEARWLKIGVRPGELADPNGYTPLSPRQEMTPAPYALYARGDGDWTISGDDMYSAVSGNVGIGTTNPGTKLDVQGGDINTSGKIKEGGNNLIPSGAVMFFNLPSCPSGWSELTTARGRYLVGKPSGGTLAGTQGTALTDLENRAVGEHDHSITDPGHTHQYRYDENMSLGSGYAHLWTGTGMHSSSSTTGITIDNEGSFSGTNAPYIQLCVCQKD